MRRIILILIAALALCITGASGVLDVTSYIVTPSGNPASGTGVNASIDVNVLNFPADNSLQFLTGMDNPAWQVTLIVNSTNTTSMTLSSPGAQMITVTGLQITGASIYPNATTALLRVNISCAAPSVTTATSMIVVQGQQRDNTSTVISSSVYLLNSTVVPAVTPTPTPATTGNISVTSSPTGSKLYLGSPPVYQGLTPYNITGLSPGNYTVTVKRTGYLDWGRKDVQVTAGNTTTLDATLTVEPTTAETTQAPTTATTTARTTVPTTKTTMKTFTPWPTDTPTQASPPGVEAGILAVAAAALLALRKG
jgi:hypothetical protein